jgi:hypothetical protein
MNPWSNLINLLKIQYEFIPWTDKKVKIRFQSGINESVTYQVILDE